MLCLVVCCYVLTDQAASEPGGTPHDQLKPSVHPAGLSCGNTQPEAEPAHPGSSVSFLPSFPLDFCTLRGEGMLRFRALA